MTPAAVTGTLLHDLVTGTHAEGITALGVETVIEHNDAVLLVAEPGPDFDDTWQLPGGPVLPGQTLTDALHPAAAAIGLTIDEVTGYLGHHGAQATTRVFRFAVTVTDPGAICRQAGTGHRWAEDLDCPPAGAARLPATINTPAATDPPLAGQLRAWARGIYPDEAGVELLIGHASFLHRADFTSRLISIPGDGAGLAAGSRRCRGRPGLPAGPPARWPWIPMSRSRRSSGWCSACSSSWARCTRCCGSWPGTRSRSGCGSGPAPAEGKSPGGHRTSRAWSTCCATRPMPASALTGAAAPIRPGGCPAVSTPAGRAVWSPGSGWSASTGRCRPISAWSSTSGTWRGWRLTGPVPRAWARRVRAPRCWAGWWPAGSAVTGCR